jgi:starch synthase
MEIYQIASELASIAKVGGLGDVIFGLSQELLRQGHLTTVLIPRYKAINFQDVDKIDLSLSKKIQLPSGALCEVFFWKGVYQGIPVIFVDPQAPFQYFESSSIYGEHNDTLRFMLFSYLCLEYISNSQKKDICLHLHDWQAAFVSVFKKLFFKQSLSNAKTVLTIHNLMHQGKALLSELQLFNLPESEDFKDPQHPLCINLLKSGMLAADHITTVSKTYAQEICSPLFSYHLDETIWETKYKTQGILNGIDYSYWNPSKKNLLPSPFSGALPASEILAAKQKNKEALQKKFHMDSGNKPLFCCISRLDHQKGPYLLAHAAQFILAQGGQYFVLGKPSTHEMYELFSKLQTHLSPKNFIFYDGFDEQLSHLVYASSDAILIPSIFEPCGLTQLIGMHYGTVPIARKTGGLSDTVIDLFEETAPLCERTGFVFEEPDQTAFLKKIEEFFTLYQDRSSLTDVVARITKKNFSWDIPAKQYLHLYNC